MRKFWEHVITPTVCDDDILENERSTLFLNFELKEIEVNSLVKVGWGLTISI